VIPPHSPKPAEPPEGGDRAGKTLLWLRRGDQLFVGTLVGAALVLMGIHWIRLSDWGAREIDIERLPGARYQYEIDINSASWVEWAQFDGVGETLARRIVADREAQGAFETVDDLLRVKGLGKKKLAAMRDHLRVQYAARPHSPVPPLEPNRDAAGAEESIDFSAVTDDDSEGEP